MNVSNGVVEAVRKDNKGLMVASNWYSSFNAFSGIVKGDVVSFNFKEKGQWKNIQGPIEKVTGVAAIDATASEVTTAQPQASQGQELPPHYMIARGYMNKVQTFPVAFDHTDRAIIRQNSLTNAVKMLGYGEIFAGIDDASIMAEVAIEVAGIFEKYSTGQLEMEEAERLIAATTDQE